MGTFHAIAHRARGARAAGLLGAAVVVLAATMGLLGLAACTREAGPGDWPSSDPYQVTTTVIESRPQLDLLFVLDNSNSTWPQRQSLIRYFSELSAYLAGHDLHIGIVTTDLGAGIFTPPSCDTIGGDQGLLQHQRGAAVCETAGLLDPDARFLASAPAADGGAPITNFAGTLEDAFACHANIREGRCNFEHQLASARAALEGCDTPGGCRQPANEGFLRPDARLAVIILTDEDDCSAPPESTLFDPAQTGVASTLGPLTSYRCFEFGTLCDGADPGREPGPRSGCVPGAKDPDPLHQLTPVESFAGFFTALRPGPGSLYVAVIGGTPSPVKVGFDPNLYPDLLPSCSGGTGSAEPGIRLAHFVSLLPPPSGRFFSTCRQDLRDVMATIGSDLSASSACLPGWGRFSIHDGGLRQLECAVEERVPQAGVPDAFERQVIPPCTSPLCTSGAAPPPPCPCAFEFPEGATACWYAEHDPVCAASDVDLFATRASSSGHRLRIQRLVAGECATTPAPTGTVTVAQCAACAANPEAGVFDCSPGCRDYWPEGCAARALASCRP